MSLTERSGAMVRDISGGINDGIENDDRGSEKRIKEPRGNVNFRFDDELISVLP